MQRVFDFSPAEHELVVSRVLVQLHQAIDASFPHARPASQRFAKTAFVGSDEPTLTQLIPGESLRETQSSHEDAAEQAQNNRKSRSRDRDPYEELIAHSDKTSIPPPSPWWRFANNMPFKQTIIGVLTLILFALIAYLLLSD